jgi:hypothetical protein
MQRTAQRLLAVWPVRGLLRLLLAFSHAFSPSNEAPGGGLRVDRTFV